MIRYNRRVYYFQDEYNTFRDAYNKAKYMLSKRQARRYKILAKTFDGARYFELWLDRPTRLF